MKEAQLGAALPPSGPLVLAQDTLLPKHTLERNNYTSEPEIFTLALPVLYLLGGSFTDDHLQFASSSPS